MVGQLQSVGIRVDLFNNLDRPDLLHADSFLYSPIGKRSLVSTAQTKTPTSKSTRRLFWSTTRLYLAVASSKFWRVHSWMSCNWVTKSSALWSTFPLLGREAKSSGQRGRKPSKTSNGLNLVLRLTSWLWANSTWPSYWSLDFICSPTELWRRFPNDQFTILVCPPS